MEKFKICVFCLLTCACLAVIFMFSANDGINSNSLSMKVLGFLISLYEKVTGAEILNSQLSLLNFIIRKCAHFTIFMTLSLLSFNMFSYIFRKKNVFAISFLFCLLMAAFDEIHQSFIPGRTGQINDVFIDLFGVVFGLFIIYLFKIPNRIKNRNIMDEDSN